MRATSLLLIPLILTGCGHSWAWKQADLDRNSLNLALFRGADSGASAAEWVEHGKVVEASGSTEHGGRDLSIIVRYEREQTDWSGAVTGVEHVCFRFTSRHGDNVQFSETDCPRKP
jgi:hypothetical protein